MCSNLSDSFSYTLKSKYSNKSETLAELGKHICNIYSVCGKACNFACAHAPGSQDIAIKTGAVSDGPMQT